MTVVTCATQTIVTITEHVQLVQETPACVLLVLLALSVRLTKTTAQPPHVKMEEPALKVMATQPRVCAPNVSLVTVVTCATQTIVTITEHVQLVQESPACVLLVLLAPSARLT